MGNSYSNLGNYVRKLLSDDAALKAFLVDPIGEAEGKNGLTKAERAVLRRTVFHLSNNSKNGYSLERHLGSYRRSLRLLQNVIDNHGAKMTMDHIAHNQHSNPGELPVNIFFLKVYYPNVSASIDLSCQTNDQIQNIGGPYANYVPYSVVLDNPNPSIQEVMDNMVLHNGLEYTVVELDDPQGQLKPYVASFTVKGMNILANLSNSCYDLKSNKDADYAFWFYTINGTANTNGIPGSEGTSFADYTVSSGDIIDWQLIAPDKKYGFHPCA